MARRLTTFSKFIITLLVVGGVFFGGRYLLNNGYLGDIGKSSGNNTKDNTKNSGSSSSDGDVIRIGVVTWGGYAGGQYFNEGFAASEQSRFYKEYGIKVEFRVLDDFDASLNAWKSGDIDLHWYTIDAFPTIANGLKDFDPVVLWQADWSRGGDAIVVRRGINSVAELKGKSVALAEMTPSHSFLLYLLNAGGMTGKDIAVKPYASAIDAADAFKSQQVDAAVVWSPDDEACVRAVNGSKVLQNTRTASNIIADIFFAKREYVEKNRDKLQKLYEGWMKGAAEINSDPAAKRKAIGILSEGLGIPEGDAEVSINNVRLVTHGDNQNFFGLNSGFQGITGEGLYRRMTTEYQSLGYADNNVPSWRQIAYPQLVQATNLSGPNNAAEGQKEFTQVSDTEGREKESIATKQVSISFRSGEFNLDENAKYIIDKEFVDIAKAFANSRIRIEGNTDNVGSRQSNISLSKKRAQAVADYLVREHGMSPNRFIIVGNGPDKPVDSNDTDSGRSKNRRTDFELVKD
ncbi:MAG: OmpA family protein [Lewinellaceae bacterium]|nr:OmpA family protein [Lewinella sp.]MCB9280882.1 OmpA family protein [Lewinellaceae bacterium]